MLIFLSIFASILKRASMANSKSFQGIISSAPFSLVLFQTGHCSDCKKILDIFDEITDKYIGNVSMVVVDADISKDLTLNYSIVDIPSIGVFNGNRFLQFYSGEWTKDSICNFCDSLLSQTVQVLYDWFEIFAFQKNSFPVNLVIADPKSISIANDIIRQFAGRLNVAILSNKSLGNDVGIEIAQITRPSDGFCKNLESLDFQLIEDSLSPLITRIENQELIGSVAVPHTLIAFVDERDPLQLYDIQKLFTNLSLIYTTNLSYQYCDFYRCTNIAKKLGIINFGNPIFLLKDEESSKYNLFAEPNPTSEEMKSWLDEYVLGIKSSNAKEIPELYARNFMEVALDSSIDVILLITVPGMQNSKEAFENFMNLIDVFRPFKRIQFYTFNPKTQLVPGLQIPKSDKPTISIWPAAGGSNGVSFSATLPFPALVENTMKLIKTKISPAHIRDIAEKTESIYKSQKEN